MLNRDITERKKMEGELIMDVPLRKNTSASLTI
jgi:hypothetical protein